MQSAQDKECRREEQHDDINGGLNPLQVTGPDNTIKTLKDRL